MIRNARIEWLACTLALGLTAAPAGAQGQRDVFLHFERTSFGPNQAVVVDLGQLRYTTGCEGKGIDDFIFQWADLYVVPSGTEISPGATLTDVSGKPNTVFAASDGAFVGEVIAYTAPGGTLPAGAYAVIVDQCQDGVFNGPDRIQDPVFSVKIPVGVPPAPGISALKAQAALRKEQWELAHSAYYWLFELAEYAGEVESTSPEAPGSEIFGFLAEHLGEVLQDPKEAALAAILNTSKHWGGIAADPLDPDFDQETALSAVVVPDATAGGALIRQAGRAARHAANEAALAASLLRAFERYQGAQRAGDGAWALLQARAARRHAILLAEAVEASDAVADVAAGVRALPSSVDSLSASLRTYVGRPDVCCAGAHRLGLPADTRREAKNLGAPIAMIDSFVRAWHDIMARITFSTNARTVMASVLEAVDSTSEAAAAELRILAADLEVIILRLEADPLVVDPWPAADAGGPYESVEGSPVLLDASASTGNIASFAWDLDGDSQFNDAVGPTASFLPPGPGNWLAGVRVVGASGHADIAYAWVRVEAANAPPVLTSPAPALRRTRIPIGESRVFVVTASDPDGDPVALEWELDGGPPAAGPSFMFTANTENAGVHGLVAMARDGRGGETRVGWIFGVAHPDGDADGWHANVDCDDADLSIHPEAPEILNGIDDDCDPATPDGGGPPSWNAGSNPPPIVLEGRTEVRVEGTSINWGVAAGRGTVTIDWGDGQMEDPPVNEREQFFARHVYQDSGEHLARACLTNSLGRTVCRAVSVRVRNLAPIVLYEDLSAFTPEVSPNRGFGGEWEVHPLGFEVVELVNGSPTFFVSPEPFPAAFDVTVQFQVDPEGDGGDDDFVGLALGYRPGDVLSPGADHVLIDVRQNSQLLGYGDCGVNPFGLEGLTVSRIRGNPTYVELWGHQDLECVTPESRIEVLVTDPTAVWTDGTLHELRARYSSERLEVFFDGTRRLDLAGSFPEGHLALYDLSQADAHFRVHVMPVYTTGPGEPLELTVPFLDWGVADTHTAVVDWGDLSPAETVPVTVPVTVNGDGTGSVTATHVYTAQGSFTGQVCITDDDGATSCRPFRVEAGNAAPVVTAGPDREAGPSLVLDAASFSDPGSQGPHTAAVDWGDGGSPEPAAVAQDAVGGLVHASHQYTSDGTYTVTVCVTDEDGAQGCGALEAHVVVTNGAPEVQVSDPGPVAEGGPPATILFAFSDLNPTDEHAVTIDWGDGTPPETPPFQDGGAAGIGRPAHSFTDSGTFPVRIQVCDGRGACGVMETVVVVANLPPVVDAGGDRDLRAGATLALEASLDDPGTADTHTAIVDWGDGGSLEPLEVTPVSPGEAVLRGSHAYPRAGSFVVEVCASDDEGGAGCARFTVRVTDAASGDFRRGDANADGRIDISDPVTTLGYLFLGGTNTVACLDAADSDDSGFLNITDPIYSLSFLFLGGPPPPAPGPAACGPDPTLDDLPCALDLACTA